MNADYYKEFKARLKHSKPISNADAPLKQECAQVVWAEIPRQPPENPVESPTETPVEEAEVKHNGHKDSAEIIDTIPDDEKTKALAQDIENTRREMLESEKTKNIPGNGYIFNREKKHLLETANISQLQLHNIAVGRIQTQVLKEGWNSLENMVEDMYLDTILEGSIAVDGKARVDFVALTQFKRDENAQAAHGSLFGTGPNG